MNSITLELIILLLLILSNGVLALAELAVVSAHKARLQQRAEAGDKGAQDALELANDPARFLSTVQIGITLIGILTGAFGGATLADEVAPLLARVPFLAPYRHGISVVLVVIVITYFSLLLGELAPKQIALSNAERFASRVAPLMKFLSRLAGPLVGVLSLSSQAVLRMLGIQAVASPEVTEEEVRILIGQGTQTGVFEPIEEEMVEQVFRLSDRRINSLMTPRPEIVWIDLEDPLDVNFVKISTSRHSQLPVGEGDLDNLLGYVRATDLLAQCYQDKDLDIRAVVEPGLFLPEIMPVFDALERFKETRAEIAFAVDEYGGLQGLVTLRDILEAIVGDIPEEYEIEDPDIVRREDGSYLLDGMVPIDEFKDLFNLGELPGEEQNYYQTLGGFVMTFLGKIPTSGDHFEWEGLRVEVVDMDEKRVDKVLVSQSE